MSLLDFLKANKNARRIFGEKEIEIIERQLLGINLTQSEKNRLSRDIRRKLGFIKEIARFSEEFDLKKGAEIKEIVNDTVEEILNDKLRKRIKEIWLFGSAVKKQQTFRSDIDIAVLFEDISKKEAFDFRLRILREANSRVDIRVLNFLSGKVKEDILKNHKVLYKNE